jgi:serine/threonine-protein kinase
MPLSRGKPALGPGDTLGGRFRLVSEVGSGGMSRVYEAVDVRYDRPAAVKVLARWLADDEEFRERFTRESAAAERVTHPHVLPVWAHGEEEGFLYFVTPLCDYDLGSLVGHRGPLPPTRALSTIAQVGWALDWAHGRGVVHRDVKPENILLISGPADDHAYLGDFGLAKVRVESTLTHAGHPAGLTPAYAAPEQWLDEAVGPAADQYALAATLYTCLAGHPPFHPRRGPSLREAHLHEPPPALTGVVPDLPHEVAAAVSRALSKSPSRRFGTCREFVTAVQVAVHRVQDTTLEEAIRPVDSPTSDSKLMETEPGAAARRERVDVPVERTPAPSEPNGAPSTPAPNGAPVAPEPAPAASEPEPVPAASGAPPAASEPAPAAPARRSRRGLLIAAGGAALAAIVLGVVLVVAGGGSDGGEPASAEGERAPAGVRTVAVGLAPIAIDSGRGGVWVGNSGDGTVSRIEPRRGVQRQDAIPAVPRPFGVAAGFRRVWVVGPNGELAGIDPQAGRRVARVELGIQSDAIEAAFDAVWIVNGTAGTVTRVEPDGPRPRVGWSVKVGDGTSDVAAGFGAVWATNSGSGTLVRLDPRSGRVLRTQRLGGALDAVAVGEGAVWALSSARGRLIRLDPASGRTVALPVPPAVEGGEVAVGDGAVFYIRHDDGLSIRIDPRTRRRVGSPVRLASDVRGATVAARALWATDVEEDRVARLGF